VVVREAQAAPNSYTGSGPLDPCRVSGRRPCLRSRPRNLSVPYAVSSRGRDRPPRGVTGHGRRRRRGIETPVGSERLPRRRIVPVSAWLGVRAASAGDGPTPVRVWLVALGTGPRRGGQSKAYGVGLVTHRAVGIQRDRLSHSFVACKCVRPGCPRSAYSSPRRAGVPIDHLLFLSGELKPRTRVRVVDPCQCVKNFLTSKGCCLRHTW
jgi:hypothetical protein